MKYVQAGTEIKSKPMYTKGKTKNKQTKNMIVIIIFKNKNKVIPLQHFKLWMPRR